jgi:hypothetical protein
MKNFGPIRGWWTLPSERGISTIKSNLNKGNYHKFYQRVYTKEFIKEYLQSEDRYSSKHKLFAKDATIVNNEDEEEVSFSDFRTELHDLSKDGYECNTFQIKPLISFMLKELQRSTEINKELYSPLLRLSRFFNKFHTRWKYKAKDFIPFLEDLSIGNITIKRITHNDDSDNHTAYVDENLWDIFKDQFVIFKKDFELVKRLFSDEYIIPIYESAYVWGVKFEGRGDKYYEFKDPTNNHSYGKDKENLEFFPSNPRNNWREKYFAKLTNKDVSSLCLVKDEDKNALHFCQINNFSKLREPMEPLLKDICFAMVVTRHCENVKMQGPQKKQYDNLYKSNLSFDPKLSIVKLKYIYPCPLAVVHLDENKNPINPYNNKKKTTSLLFFLLYRNRAMLIDNPTLNETLLQTDYISGS